MNNFVNTLVDNWVSMNSAVLSQLPDSVFRKNAQNMLEVQAAACKSVFDVVTETNKTLLDLAFSVKPSTSRK
jgi:hypothetical protein